MVNILITAGGTSEPIDNVRSITNTGTGRLGSLIADAFAAYASVDKIFYICAHNSVRPLSCRITCVEIKSVDDLQSAVTDVLKRNQIDAVIHSMAVSDYRVKAISTLKALASFLQKNDEGSFGMEKDILEAIVSTDIRTDKGKMSSQLQDPLILLERTPKILPLFRKLAPDTIIVGFKLLSHVSLDELLDTAYHLLVRNGCDYVLANDASQIDGEFHKGFLIDTDRTIQAFQTKQEIADGITKAILKEVDTGK